MNIRTALVYFIIGWQVVILVLYAAWVFEVIYAYFPPNPIGWIKLVRDGVALTLFEIPAIMALGYLLATRKRRVNAVGDDSDLVARPLYGSGYICRVQTFNGCSVSKPIF
jgi:hypothetical protein